MHDDFKDMTTKEIEDYINNLVDIHAARLSKLLKDSNKERYSASIKMTLTLGLVKGYSKEEMENSSERATKYIESMFN